MSKNLRYPAIGGNLKSDVIITVRFIINEDGLPSDFDVVKGADSAYNDEAIRVLKNMPAWMPGINNGNYVRVYVTQLVTFKPR